MTLIPLPRMSEFLLNDFMLPMGINAQVLSYCAGIPINEVQAILNDEINITPEISQKLGAFFGVSGSLFSDIQSDLFKRENVSDLQYAY